MYLSRLHLNAGDARARRDIGDPYEMHSTLCRAFSDSDDARPRPFLWRIETARTGSLSPVLVQSASQPNWARIAGRMPDWSSAIDTREFDLEGLVARSPTLRFRLRANPTVTRNGRRFGLHREVDQLDWLRRQGERLGFGVDAVVAQEGTRITTRKRTASGGPVVVFTALFDGVLSVKDEGPFCRAVSAGLGHARFLGLGLLSVAPVSG